MGRITALLYQNALSSWRMVSSGMLRRVSLVRTDVSEELSASFVGVTRIGEIGTTLVVSSNRRTLLRLLVTASVFPSSPILTLMKEALSSSEMSVFTRATRRNIQEDTILHSHRRGNLKSYLIIMFTHPFNESNISVLILCLHDKPEDTLHVAEVMHSRT
jgi:hypothetical protein